MKVLQVFYQPFAEKMKENGYCEIKTQYDIEQKQVWTFVYDKSKPVCFDIEEATRSGHCRIADRFKMSF